MSYQAKLRAFADYLDDHPVIASRLVDDYYTHPRASIYCENWDDFQSVISALGGYEKHGYGGSIEAVHKAEDTDGATIYKVDVNVSNVCVRTPKTDENGNPVMRKVRQYVETDDYEQEYEWSCPDVWSDKK
jgi:hypothetical protein